eukprot:1159942-Pelagomonas_calceolata.AAC.10
MGWGGWVKGARLYGTSPPNGGFSVHDSESVLCAQGWAGGEEAKLQQIRPISQAGMICLPFEHAFAKCRWEGWKGGSNCPPTTSNPSTLHPKYLLAQYVKGAAKVCPGVYQGICKGGTVGLSWGVTGSNFGSEIKALRTGKTKFVNSSKKFEFANSS